jgi:hydrogenase nickel incorporation protein HypB
MCGTCGCDTHDIELEKNILEKNNHLATHNREHFDKLNLDVFNIISSPGSGKTTLLEKTISLISEKRKLYVIEGDQHSSQDANRIEKAGAKVVQVNTGAGCHLDSSMIHNAVHQLEPEKNSLLIIENVGNLVCPAMFDLGEEEKIVVMSVTEGHDKPLKYPTIFEQSTICVINKIDLLPYVNFDVEEFKKFARGINPKIHFFELSATTGEGFDPWISFLMDKANAN